MKALLTIFRNRLLDLSASNRSVFLPKTFKGKYSDVMSWDFKSAYAGLEIVKQLTSGKSLVKIADVQHLKGDEIDLVLNEAKRMLRTHQLILEETGSADFYVGWPFVEGVLKNGMPLRAPLIFFPYTLKIVGREVFLEKTIGAEPFWNRSLFLSLSLYEEYQFDKEWLEQPVTAIEDLVDQDFRIALMNQLKEKGLTPSFSRDFLATNLTYFLPCTKEELTTRYTPGNYQLVPHAVMGLFPQSTSYIHSDYDVLKKITEEKTVEQSLSTFISPDFTNLTTSLQFTPLAIDGSQENIITKVVDGQSLVVQGPPGSGKTQLICNLVAQFLGKGKKVLVVCQKKAALDVIYDRLDQLELSTFVSLVHDAVADKKTIYTKLSDQISCADEYKQKNIHPDTIILEKEFSRIQTAISRLQLFFTKYKEALYDLSIGGDTAHALYLEANRNADRVDLTNEFRAVMLNELDLKAHDLEHYLFYFTALQSDFELLKSINAHFYLGGDDKDSLLTLLNKIPACKDQIQVWEKEEPYLSLIPISYAKDWSANIAKWKETSLIYIHNITYSRLVDFNEHVFLQWVKQVKESFDCIYTVENIPSVVQSKYWIVVLENSKKSFVQRNWFKLVRKLKHASLSEWSDAQQVKWNGEGFDDAIKKLQAILTLRMLQSEWSNFSFIDSKAEFSKENYFKNIATWKQVLLEKEALFEIPALSRLWTSHDEFKERLNLLIHTVQSRAAILNSYFDYWTPTAVDELFEKETYRNSWLSFTENKFDFWLGFTQLKTNLDPMLWRSFEKSIQHATTIDKLHVIATWKQSIMQCWIEEKERVAPILKTVSTPEWHFKEEELKTLIKRRYSISLEFLKIKLREWVYTDITYNRLNRQVTYRDLNYQVSKKRNVWPLRKILATHEEEVLTLLPCWLVSPETASMVFPLHGIFDLVIFDEASQCFVEKAFPTLFRGKQVVVIGDSKQLKPNDLYRVRYRSEDEEEDIDSEVESLLDFSNRYLPSQMLKGHYRSKSEHLIRFSNEHFYNSELRVIPDIAFAHAQVLHYEKVNGLWENNTNRIEAEKVVELVKSFIQTHSGKSIGVITFNYQQSFLIRELLEESKIEIPADLMVKNIENVQGDERDIIIFSVAYAKNSAGKMMSQFGSLSQDGGENRLNVAITRAREKVVVVSSILPDDLHVDHHKNNGVQLLKAYMQFVYEHTIDIKEVSTRHKQTTTGLVSVMQNQFPERFATPHFSDLHDKQNSDRLLFADEQRYFYAPSVLDWHGYSRNMFEQKGWKLDFFNARNYWLDKDKFLKSIAN